MATGAPNAILAINSLDRYINTVLTDVSLFQATWANGATVLTLEPVVPPNKPPLVRGRIISAGIQKDTFITAIVGNQITINKATTAAANVATTVVQYFTTAAANQPISSALYGAYADVEPYSYNFQIERPNALINGYIQRIVVSQIQIQYNIPTVNLDKNDLFYIYNETDNQFYDIQIPFGFYTPEELAAVLETIIQVNIPDIQVTFDTTLKFTFESASKDFWFSDPIITTALFGLSNDQKNNMFRTLRMLGMTTNNSGAQGASGKQESFDYPNFLYTPFIDIYSNVLTNYQTIKDGDTSISNRKGLVARVYLSGVSNGVITTNTAALGCSSFVLTTDLNSPKIIRWTPDVAVPSLDFQLRDCYDDFIPGAEQGYSTEWQMTLLCIEGREWNS